MAHGTGSGSGKSELMASAERTEIAMAIFDFDRTVTRHGTWLPYLDFVLHRRRLRRLWPLIMLRMARAWAIDRSGRTGMKEAALGVALAGMRRSELEQLAKGYAEQVIGRGLRPGAIDAIGRHKQLGHRLVLATASIDLYATEVAQRLGFDVVVATRAAWTGDDRLASRLDGPNLYGRDKLTAVIEALDNAHRTYAIAAYSDHISDLPLLSWCEFPVAVNPSRKLRHTARASNFVIEDWNHAAGAPANVPRPASTNETLTNLL